MKRVHRSFIKSSNWALAGILSLLGFSGMTSCEATEEYGSPHADYTIKGKVTNEAKQAIPNLKIEILSEREYPITESETDANGKFQTSFDGLGENYSVAVSDLDGDVNGAFENDTIDINFTKDDYIKKGSGWYQGELLKEIEIVLKEKE